MIYYIENKFICSHVFKQKKKDKIYRIKITFISFLFYLNVLRDLHKKFLMLIFVMVDSAPGI